MAQADSRWEQLRAAFTAELDERVRELNRLLLRLESGELDDTARRESLDGLFREAHSLKGAARAVELPAVEQVAHELEAALDAARRRGAQPEAAWFDEMYRAVDALPAAYETGEDAAQAPADQPAPSSDTTIGGLAPLRPSVPSAPEPRSHVPSDDARRSLLPSARGPTVPGGVSAAVSAGDSPPTSDTVRVALGKLDALLGQAGELAVTHTRIEQRLSELRALRQDLQTWRRAWRTARALRLSARHVLAALAPAASRERHDLEGLLRLLEQAEQHTRELAQQTEETFGQLRQDTAQLGLISRAIGDVVMAVRLLPVATVFAPFERLVRDLARATGKQVQLVLEGGETEIDRKVLEQLRDPLVHMLRNAVDHGIESAEDRLARGKTPQGTLRLSAGQRGGAIEIELADDGQGLDPGRLRETAVARGVLSAEQANALGDRAALELIFRPGFSTRTTVNEMSGRGVGMDVVRQNVERLNGHVAIASRPGAGTRFTITVPLTLTTTRAVLAEQSGQLFAIPARGVERSLRARPVDVVRLEGRPAIPIDGHAVPLVELAAVLERPPSDSADRSDWYSVLVLRQGERRLALLVDRLAGEREVVVKPLGWPLRRVRNLSGAAVLGSGQLVLILNPADVLKSGFKLVSIGTDALPRPAPAAPASRRRRLLVVDDSLTTRTLERSIFEAAGYDVVVAGDGAEALRTLRGDSVDLVVSDVDMPILDGFGLTAEIRRDERLKQIPVVLVTSLDAREHRERGVAVGADAYVVKSSFDQDQLLDTVSRLL